MYNEELKLKFIKTVFNTPSMAVNIEVVFNKTSKYEVIWGHDVCQATSEEISDLINNSFPKSTAGRNAYWTVLKKYITYCREENYPGVTQDDIYNINISGLDVIRSQMVRDSVDLEKYLNEVYNPIDKRTVDNTFRCFHWLAYMGFNEEEVDNIKCSDVDLKQQCVNLIQEDGLISIKIPREAFETFKSCKTETEFMVSNKGIREPAPMNRVLGDKLLRSVRGNQSSKTLKVNVVKKQKEAFESGRTDKKKLTFSNLWLSGQFYKIYLKEVSGEDKNPDFKDLANEYVKSRKSKAANTEDRNYIKLTAKKYAVEYNLWKNAFNL